MCRFVQIAVQPSIERYIVVSWSGVRAAVSLARPNWSFLALTPCSHVRTYVGSSWSVVRL